MTIASASGRLALAALGLVIAGAAAADPIPASRPARPNIIFILADDLGYGDLGCCGQTRIRTPRIDRMAAEGMRFTQHYSGSTVCAPSRCALMTGRHTGHCTVRGNVDVLMEPDEPTIATVLKAAGYATACIGKWGIGHPPPPDDPSRHGFDHFFGYLSMWHAHNSYPDFLWRNGEKVPLRNVVRHPSKHYKPGEEGNVGLATKKVEYAPDLFAEEALAFIERAPKPFFLFFATTIPHVNNEASSMGGTAMGAIGMEVPDLGIYAGEDWPEVEKAKAAMISRLDRDVGRILDRLEALGIDGDTLVLFSSDNGPHKEGVDPAFFRSGGPLRGVKRDLYEGGIRVPLIARWPGRVRAGSTSEHVSAFWDVLPTLADAAGARKPANLDGISFLPALLGEPQPAHAYLYWEFHERGPGQAVRLGDWKAVRRGPSRPIELYDLARDIGETRDLAPEHPEVVRRIEVILASARTGDDAWPIRPKTSR
ncbi:MAG: arylsulfatase [Planctomycetes bacterium]|nr:arylsulfatase [Planctomycetota bacterium]